MPGMRLLVVLLGAFAATSAADKDVLARLKNDGCVFAFKGGRDDKYCADDKGGLHCDRKHLDTWEKFTVTVTGDKIALTGGRTKKVLRGRIRCLEESTRQAASAL